jgi:hypothetical protein
MSHVSFIAALMAAASVFVMPAVAAAEPSNNTGSSTTTVKDLEAKGYECEVVAAGFKECTKAGETTYWCATGRCIPKPLVKPKPPPRPPGPVAPGSDPPRLP